MTQLQKQLHDQIHFFQVVLKELDSKQSELNSTFQASLQYLRRDMTVAKEAQHERLLKHISDKKAIFESYIEENGSF